jgi:MFS family permease
MNRNTSVVALDGTEPITASRPPPVEVAEETAEAGSRPTVLLPLSHLIRISAYWLGLTAIDTAVSQFIGYRLAYSDLKGAVGLGTATAVVSLGGAVVAIFIQPTVGSISDYTVTRWGRRKPYIVFGSLLDVVFLLGIAYSNTLFAITAFVILLQFSTNTARGPFQGYVPDLVAEKQVGTASGLVGMMQILGNITGYALASLAAILGSLPLALIAVAVVELVTMVSVVLRVGKGLPPKPRMGRSWPSIARETWGTDILKERSYVWLLASRLFFLMAGGIMFAFAIAYLKYVFGYDQQGAGAVNAVLLVAVAVASVIAVVPASRLSDRTGRKPVIYLACLIGAIGVGTTALAPAVPIAICGAALYGAASGTFLAVDWALMTDIIPRASAGRYMGLSNVATGSATLLAAVVGGLVLDAVTAVAGEAAGPRASFLVAVALYGVAAMLLRPVVEPRRGRAPAKEEGLPIDRRRARV